VRSHAVCRVCLQRELERLRADLPLDRKRNPWAQIVHETRINNLEDSLVEIDVLDENNQRLLECLLPDIDRCLFELEHVMSIGNT
jgi:hypothetical protein